MTEKVGFEINIDGGAGVKELKTLSTALDGMTDSLDALGTEADETSADLKGAEKAADDLSGGMKDGEKSTGMFSGGMAKLAVAGAAVYVGLQAIGGVLSSVTEYLGASLEAWDEQADVNNRFNDSLMMTGLSLKEAEAAAASYEGTIGKLASATNFGDEAIKDALGQMNNWTGQVLSAAEAESELSTILGISKTKRIEAKDAAKEYSKAIEGDVGAAKEFLGLNKEQEEALNALTDSAERGAKIQTMLKERYEGVAESIDPYQRSTKNLSDAYGDLQQKVGEAITTSGAFAPIMDMITGSLRSAETWIDSNKEAIRGWIFDGIDKGIDGLFGLMDTIQALSPVLTGVITYLKVTKNWFTLLFDAVGLVGKGIWTLGNVVIAGVVKYWGWFLDAAKSVAEYIDADFADALGRASEGLDAFGNDRLASAAGSWGEMKKDAVDAGASIDGIADAFASAPKTMAEIDAGIESLKDRIAGMRAGLKEARAAAEASDGEGGDVEKREKEVEDAETLLAVKKEEKDLTAERELLANRQLAILLESNDGRRLALELDLGLYELESKSLTDGERELETTRLLLDYKRGLADLEATAAADAEKRRAAELKGIEDAKKARNAAHKSAYEQAKALTNILVAGFESAGVSARAISLIRGAQYAAEAIGSAIFGNPVAAVSAGIASAQHFAVAGGGGGGGGGGGVSASAGNTFSRADSEAATRDSARLYAEELVKLQERPIVIETTIHMGSSVHLRDAPETAAEIRDALTDSYLLENIDISSLAGA